MRRFRAQLLSTPGTVDQQLPLEPFNNSPQNLLSTNFAGRLKELEFISRMFQPKGSESPPVYGDSARCAIFGMPGLGKTQLALKYATDSFESRHYSFIFWISAASVEKVDQGVRKMLAFVNHAGQYHHDQSMLLVTAKCWLETHSFNDNARWLLVLDNVDKSAVELIQDFLPSHKSRGDIIITTNTEDVARDIVNVSRDRILELQVPGVNDSTALLLRTAGVEVTTETSSSSQITEDLVKCVGCLPLAVAQAASFMKEARKTPGEMLTLYNSAEKLKVSVEYCSERLNYRN
jgi:hypothetical protein